MHRPGHHGDVVADGCESLMAPTGSSRRMHDDLHPLRAVWRCPGRPTGTSKLAVYLIGEAPRLAWRRAARDNRVYHVEDLAHFGAEYKVESEAQRIQDAFSCFTLVCCEVK